MVLLEKVKWLRYFQIFRAKLPEKFLDEIDWAIF